MAHTLKFQYGSETALDLSSGDYYIVNYVPNPSGKDKLTLVVSGSVYATFITNIHAINRKFIEARNRRWMGRGDRIYVLWSPDGDANTYRSELYADEEDEQPGVVTIPETFMRNVIWDTKQIKLTITLQRRPYWEDNSATALTLSNFIESGTTGVEVRNPMDTTSPLVNGATDISFTASTNRITSGASRFGSLGAGDIFTVYGSTFNDSTYTVSSATSTTIDVNEDITDEASGDTIYMYNIVNYVDINGTELLGDLPGRFTMKYTDTAGTNDPGFIHYGSTYINPTAVVPIYEGEASGYSTAKTPSSGQSGNYYQTYSIATASLVDILQYTWGTNRLVNYDGGYYRLFYHGSATAMRPGYYLPRYKANSVEIWRGNEKYTASAPIFLDLGTVPIPPWSKDSSSPMELEFFVAIDDCSSLGTNACDYIALIPAENYRYAKFGTWGGAGYSLVDDGILEQTYFLDTSGNEIGSYGGIGAWPTLMPGRNHRMFFLVMQDNGGTAQQDQTGDVIIQYRARRTMV